MSQTARKVDLPPGLELPQNHVVRVLSFKPDTVWVRTSSMPCAGRLSATEVAGVAAAVSVCSLTLADDPGHVVGFCVSVKRVRGWVPLGHVGAESTSGGVIAVVKVTDYGQQIRSKFVLRNNALSVVHFCHGSAPGNVMIVGVGMPYVEQ